MEEFEGEIDRERRRDSDCAPTAPLKSRCIVDRRHFLIQAGAVALWTIGCRSAVSAQDKPAVKVGFILPQKGPLAPEAQSLIAGFELFLAEHPQDAAFIQIARKDPGPDEERTLETLAELLLDGNVKFLVGPLTAEASEKVVHGVSGRLITFVTNSSVRLVGGEMCSPDVFRIAENACQTAQPLAPWALTNVGQKVFLVGSDDTVANEEVDFFAHTFERSGGMFVDRIVVGNGAAKFKDIVETIRKSPADLVFAAFRDKLAVDFLKAVRAASPRFPHPIVGPESLIEYPSTLAREGKTANNVRTLTAIQDPKDLVGRIKQRLNRDVTHASRAAQGYDAAAVIWQAMRVTTDQAPDLARLISAVEGVEVDGARGRLRFDKNHEPILEIMVQEWDVKEKASQRRIVAKLGPFESPDFGCGKVGFPPRPEGEPPENDRAEDEG